MIPAAASDSASRFFEAAYGLDTSRVFELRAPMMVKNDYSDVTMKCSVWQKDMAVIGQFARQQEERAPGLRAGAAGSGFTEFRK